MADVLLELFSEEIPARMQAEAARQLETRFAALLAETGLAATGIDTFVTPRRLALIAHGLPAASAATREERRGPRADAPDKAIAGFLKATGLTREQLEVRDDPKGQFLYAVIDRPGAATSALLARHLPQLISDFHWPKSQRWGAASTSTASPRWVRPLRAIVALLDEAVIPFAALGVTAGRTTYGHRFMGGGVAVDIASVSTYRQQLRDAYVILSSADRAQTIRDGAAAAASAAGLTLIPDAGLEAENAGLTEWPVPLAGRFDPEYLTVPAEIIQLTMRTNQKYFACADGAGKLAPAFVCVANIAAADDGRAIIAGNERVLSARLSDARFFWEQDVQIPLEQQAEKLAGIVFHDKLGTMADKVARVAKLAQWLAGQPSLAVDPAQTVRAARLARADLVTGTVGEFPELQGVIGGHLAAAQGETAAVAAAIASHYAPAPEEPVAATVALADRLDTLFAFFSVGEVPTGSRDPFALRRAALGIIALVSSRAIDLNRVWTVWAEGRDVGNDVQAQVLAFLAGRLEVQQRDAGIRHDHIRAATHWQGAVDGRIDRIIARARSLDAMLASDDGANLLAGTRRAANILRIEEGHDGHAFTAGVRADLLADPAEQALNADLDRAAAIVATAVEAEAFPAAMAALAGLRPAIDHFFDVVTVNADDPALRANRLALLAKLRVTASSVADFSQIEG